MTLSLSDGRSADVFRDAGGTYRLSSDGTTSVAAWRGAVAYATVSRWYNQTRLGQDAVQPTIAKQPLLNETLGCLNTRTGRDLPLPFATHRRHFALWVQHGDNDNYVGGLIGSAQNAPNSCVNLRMGDSVYRGTGSSTQYWFYTQSIGVDSSFVGTCAAVNTVAVTYTGSLYRGYVNSTLVQSMAFTNTLTPYGLNLVVGDTTLLGMRDEHFNGDIYGVAVHDSVLGAAALDAIGQALRVT